MDEIEIPEAIRESIELSPKHRPTKSLFLPIAILSCLGIGGLLVFLWLPQTKFFASKTKKTAIAPVTSPQKTKPPQAKLPQGNEIEPQTNVTEISPAKSGPDNLLGHLPYDAAPQSSLEAITADGRLMMRATAAQKFKQMQADARAEGVILAPISAFRTTETQSQLFFGVKEQRVQDAAKRAEVSAPPGYSEHHTGYAIDIGDGNAPATNLETDFAQTAAFKWLEENALKYSFELSFPPNNEQGVSYEPWHWRFVGDRHSLETFYKVRN